MEVNINTSGEIASNGSVISNQKDIIAVQHNMIQTLGIQQNETAHRRHFRLRFNSLDLEACKSNSVCVKTIKYILNKSRVKVPAILIIGAWKEDGNSQSIIVEFATRKYMVKVYRARKRIRKKFGCKIQVNLSKERLQTLQTVRKVGQRWKEITGFEFVFANIDGNLVMKIKDKFEQFSTVEDAMKKLGIKTSGDEYNVTDDELDITVEDSPPTHNMNDLFQDNKSCRQDNSIYKQKFPSWSNHNGPTISKCGNSGNPEDSIKQSIAYTSCFLCECNTTMSGYVGFLGDNEDKTSCFLCDWEVEDNENEAGDENMRLCGDEDERSSINKLIKKPDGTVLFDDFYKKRSDSYGMNSDKVDESNNLSYKCDKISSTEAFHLDVDVLELNPDYFKDMNEPRTSPDGGECIVTDDYDEKSSMLTPSTDLIGWNEHDVGLKTTAKDGILMNRNELVISQLMNKKLFDRKPPGEFKENSDSIERRKSTVYESFGDSFQNKFEKSSKCILSSRFQKCDRNLKMKKRSQSVDEINLNTNNKNTVLQRTLSANELTSASVIPENTSYVPSSNEDEKLYEKWIDYLEGIEGGVLLAGNEPLRYIWQHIILYYDHLHEPLDQFLKDNLETSKQIQKSLREMEDIMLQKAEQYDKEISKIYNDIEQAMQLEREEVQKTLREKEESARKETQKVVQMKEQEIETLVLLNNALNINIAQIEVTNEELKFSKDKINLQLSLVTEDYHQLRKVNDTLEEMNREMEEKMLLYDVVMKEQEDTTYNANKLCERTEKKYREVKQSNIELIEENEFLKLTANNLTLELKEMKAKNRYFNEQGLTIQTDERSMCKGNDEDNYDFESRYEKEAAVRTFPVLITPIINHYHHTGNDSRSTSLLEEVTPFLDGNTPLKTSSLNNSSNFIYDEISYKSGSVNNTQILDNSTNLIKDDSNFKTDLPNSSQITNRSPKKDKSASPQAALNTARYNLNRIISPNKTSSQIRLASTKQTDYKVIFTGDCNVGKTSLIRRICYGKFRTTREQTFEPDCLTKDVQYNDQTLKLKLWDTMGQERFNSIPPSYFRKSDIVILMYDIAEEVSFINAKTWIRIIHDYTNENTFILLVANKSDLHHKRMVAKEKGLELATNNDAMFIETSARSGESVDELCQMMASTLIAREETVLIRKDFESSLCSLSYSMSSDSRRIGRACCSA